MKIIGIDGGGTKTISYLADENLNIIDKLQTASSNYLSVGIDAVERNLKYILSCLAPKDEEYILSLGLAGISRTEDIKVMEFLLKQLNVKNYVLNNDAYIALHGAHNGEDGALLIAGTGSILYYKNNDEIKRAGGYGHILGDKGSGYSIGKEAISLALETNDGLKDSYELLKFITDFYSLSSIDDLIPMIYRGFDKGTIAKLTRDLLEKGINFKGVKDILEKEAKELVNLSKILPRNSKIALSGGLLENSNYYSDLVKELLNKDYRVVERINQPVIGALFVGKKALLRKD